MVIPAEVRYVFFTVATLYPDLFLLCSFAWTMLRIGLFDRERKLNRRVYAHIKWSEFGNFTSSFCDQNTSL